MGMSPTETLNHEHKIVLMVLEGAEREATAIKAGAAVHAEKVEQMVDFFKNFVDRCHHAKEERHLFPALLLGVMAAVDEVLEEVHHLLDLLGVHCSAGLDGGGLTFGALQHHEDDLVLVVQRFGW